MKSLGSDDPRAAGAYRLLGILGSGGMGRVYLARSPGGRTVAVKVIRPEFASDPAFRARFRREVEAARRVSGRWTARVLDADADADPPYLVTAYIPGPSLLDAVRRHGPLPPRTVRALGAGLAEALEAVHAAGVVHRDLKPSNVLITVDGPTVIDFGIARAVDATVLTQAGALIGSPAFVSPEQITGGEVGPASDVFALGSVLAFAATGAGPFAGAGTPAVMYGILTAEPQLTAVPPDLRGTVEACLHKAPQGRPRPAEIRRALAPDGTGAAALWADWLPPDLVSGLVRQAVDVLDLDTGDTGVTGVTGVTAYSPPPVPTRAGGDRRALAVVAAVGALCLTIIVAAVVLLGSRGSRGSGDGAAEGTGLASSAPRAPIDDSGATTTRPGELPDGYAGSWEGRIVSRLGVAQNMVITLQPGGTGQTIGHSETTLLGLEALGGAGGAGSTGIRCVGDQELVGLSEPPSAGAPPAVVLRDIPGTGDNPTLLPGVSLCTSGGTSRLSLSAAGELVFQSEEDDAGRPTGTLRRRG
ncbi:serine/threonine-protein kinase [Parafrankia elaeagni]|uniref:serine/threonine-protein kinase n=1 Tax=Parafrankia elaeagni TaxID=222534 RepID=UPI000365D5ED|nr:serine/threonine-protein kinase [Parafrankia elaeagni]